MVTIQRFLGIINWSLLYIAILVFISIFLIIFKHRRDLRDISLLLTFNTCLYALLTCIAACIMTSSNLLTGFLINNMTFCFAWGLFYDFFQCLIYYSYCLQAFFRLCRVVFYKKKFLLSYSLYIILIIAQWIFLLILLVPPVFINWYVHIPTETFCLVPYTYVGPEVYHILILYLIPLVCIATAYIWITRYIRETSRSTSLTIAATQRRRNQRDLTVLKRIIMLISILIVLRFPTIIFMVYGVIVGALHPLTYGIVGVITSGCLIFIGIITIYITPQLRKSILGIFFHRNNRIQTGPMPLNQLNGPIPAPATTA